jgi:hypothetical protein
MNRKLRHNIIMAGGCIETGKEINDKDKLIKLKFN